MTERTCSIEGCERKPHGRGLCATHRMRQRKGQPLDARIFQRRNGVCSVAECDDPDKSRGWCVKHYTRWKRHGDPQWERDQQPPCSHPGCDRPFYAKGYCFGHYKRQRGGLPMDAPFKRQSWAGVTCSEQGCDRPARCRGLCSRHYLPLWRTESGAVYLAAGYEQTYVDGKPVQVHRQVMERILGRPLRSYETVHHLNGVRNDNRPDNLELWTRPQPAGQRPEDLADWVVEHYPQLVEASLRGRQLE